MQPLLAISWSALILKEHITAAVPLTALAVLAAMAICLKTRDTSTSPGARRDADRQTVRSYPAPFARRRSLRR
jgi:drug/metabolite transporter (DMT)-like permease